MSRFSRASPRALSRLRSISAISAAHGRTLAQLPRHELDGRFLALRASRRVSTARAPAKRLGRLGDVEQEFLGAAHLAEPRVAIEQRRQDFRNVVGIQHGDALERLRDRLPRLPCCRFETAENDVRAHAFGLALEGMRRCCCCAVASPSRCAPARPVRNRTARSLCALGFAGRLLAVGARVRSLCAQSRLVLVDAIRCRSAVRHLRVRWRRDRRTAFRRDRADPARM